MSKNQRKCFWLALLIVTVALVVMIAGLGFAALRLTKKATGKGGHND